MDHTTVREPDETGLARLLFGELAHTLDRALGAERGVEGAIDDALDRAAASAREGDLGLAAFDGMHASESHRFERAFTAARAVAALGGLDVPEPEAFWEAGADRARIARALIADPALVPIPAPHGLGAARWTELYRAAARRQGSTLSLTAPLSIAPEVQDAFATFDRPAQQTPVSVAGSRERRASWTLRAISCAPAPPRTGVNHGVGPHPTLPEMLMLQLMRIVQGEGPVDQQSFTWVDGTFSEGRFAVRHFYDAAHRGVGVNAREVGNQGPHLGARHPVG